MLENLKIVMLESPYTTLIDNPLAKDLFAQMAELKIKGYKEMYQHGVLPLDATDFVGTHLLVCQEGKEGLRVVMGYKSTNLSVCDQFSLPFSIYEIVKNHGSIPCREEFEYFLSRCRQNKQEVSYDTSWTIDPKVRGDKELQGVLKDLTCALLVHHHLDYGIKYWLTFGICKYKTDLYFEKIGAKDVSKHSRLKQPVLFQTEARTMLCDVDDYTTFALETAQKYLGMWQARLTIKATNEEERLVAA